MKKNLKTIAFFAAFSLLFLSSCYRTDDTRPIINTTVNSPVDDITQVTASVSGIVLDENNVPLSGAAVTSNSASAITNALGMFYLNNISLSKNNGSVTVTKAGYFKGVRSFKTTAGKNHQVKVQLMQRVLSGTLNGATGGTITLNGGASINFPANAFATNSGAAYTGTVKVYSRWIDPTANNLPYIIPGDLRGLSTTNVENILETYGMVGAELEDATGNALVLAAGKTAGIGFPIPAALSATAPATIAFWHFDIATARWREEGSATRVGNNYTAQVNKFSFWNCDVGTTNFIVLDYTLINAANNSPFAGTLTRIRVASGNGAATAVTNSSGFVSGLVPRNQQLVLEVLGGECPSPIYTQNIGPFTSNTSLGNINVNLPASKYISFTGRIVNCLAAAVTNGYVSLSGSGGNSGFAATDASGNFSFSILNCTGSSLSYSYLAVDNAASQQSSILSGTATTSAINLGTITACSTAGSAVDVYVSGFEPLTTNTANNTARIWKNGTVSNLTDGSKNVAANSVYVLGNDVYAAGVEYDANLTNGMAKLWKNGVVTNLTSGTTIAQANAVFASGTDVYVGGSEGTFARIWKNGVPLNLNDGSNSAHVKALFISGADVYAAGDLSNAATVWKNGTVIFTSGMAQLHSIFVLGTDVYVAGSEYNGSKNIAKVWKNGLGTNLTNGSSEAEANSVFVSGNDVYVAGNETNIANFFTVAKLWKNGVATNLTNGLRFGNATGVRVAGSDVYVCGHDQVGAGSMLIIVWKNGFPVNITDGTKDAFSTSIFVK